MERPWDVIGRLGSTTKRLEKESILRTLDSGHEFWHGANLALDTFKMFGIKKLPRIPDSEHATVAGDMRPRFDDMTSKLISRRLTGNAARDAVLSFARACTKEQWVGWYARILSKDLDCGAGEALINKFAPEHLRFEPFGVQLAKSMKDIPTEKLFRRAHIEAKYDGARTLWFIRPVPTVFDDPFGDDVLGGTLDYEVKCLSRSGKELTNFGEIAAQLGQLAKTGMFKDGVVIDGEVVSHSFNQLMTQFRRKDFSDVTVDAHLVTFDVVDYQDFIARRTTDPFDVRRSRLESMVTELHHALDERDIMPLVNPSVSLKDIDPVTQQGEVMEFFEKQLKAGFEGVIVKDATAPYVFDRTDRMLKIKPTITVDLTVVGFTPGKGKFEGTLGALDCEGTDEAGRRISVGVSGISDELRDMIWGEGIDAVRGRTVEVMADAVSKNRDGTYSLRFPRFKSFRNDR